MTSGDTSPPIVFHLDVCLSSWLCDRTLKCHVVAELVGSFHLAFHMLKYSVMGKSVLLMDEINEVSNM